MATFSNNPAQRGAIQRLESLRRAGVTHVRRQVIEPVAPLPEQKNLPPVTKPIPTITPPSQAPPPRQESIPVARKPAPSFPLIDITEPLPLNQFSPQEATDALHVVQQEVAQCQLCEELATTRTQTVFGVGNPRARICFFGEAPGADEDRLGEPFVGRSGKLLTDIIEKGMKIKREEIYILNVLRCRPPGNRNPKPDEIHNCQQFLHRQLEIIAPEFICCLGAFASKTLLQSEETIGRLRGRWHDWRGIRVMATYHPAYLLRNPAAKKQTWEDIQMLLDAMAE